MCNILVESKAFGPIYVSSVICIHRERLVPGHETPLIAIIAIGLALAFVLGLAAHRLRVSPLVGYLLAGIAVGPFTPGFVADQSLANQLAEIGVILLMFAVGLHFSLKDLMAVRTIALPGAVVQIAVATLLGIALARSLGWTMGAGLIFGLSLSVASTVVLTAPCRKDASWKPSAAGSRSVG